MIFLAGCGTGPGSPPSPSSPASKLPDHLPLTYTIEPLADKLVRGKEFPIRCILTNVSDTLLIVNPDFLLYGYSYRYTPNDKNTLTDIDTPAYLRSSEYVDTQTAESSEKRVMFITEIGRDYARERVLTPGESLTEVTTLIVPDLKEFGVSYVTFELGYQYPNPETDTLRHTEMIRANPITVRLVP